MAASSLPRRPSMLEPRWRKMLRDAWLHKSRTALVVLTITIGMIGAGSILNAWALVRLATAETYRSSHPVSATLRIEPLDAALIEQVRRLPGIAAVRARRSVYATEQSGGEQHVVALHALDDFDTADIGRIRSELGT